MLRCRLCLQLLLLLRLLLLLWRLLWLRLWTLLLLLLLLPRVRSLLPHALSQANKSLDHGISHRSGCRQRSIHHITASS